jgi:hypothetical protein
LTLRIFCAKVCSFASAANAALLREKYMKRLDRLLALGAAALLSGGALLSSGGCSSSGAGLGIATLGISSLVGVAAAGRAIGGATVTIKDADGHVVTATTNPITGTYTADIAGFSTPFLVEVVSATATTPILFSLGNEAGTLNVHPYTDLIVRSYFDATGQSLTAVFGNPASATVLPTPDEVQTIAGVVRTVIGNWLQSVAHVDPATFDLFSGTLTANATGLDQLLDISTVSGGSIRIDGSSLGIAQTTTATIAGSGGTISGGATTNTPSGTSNVSSTATVATQSAQQDRQQAAIDGVKTLFTKFTALATQSPTATAADWENSGIFDANYLNSGRKAHNEALGMATDVSGLLVFQLESIDRIVAFHDDANTPSNQTIELIFTLTLQAPNNPPAVEQETQDKDASHGLVFRNQGNGTWKWYGDQKFARVHVSTQENNSYPNGASGDTQWQVDTLPGAFSSVNTTGNGPPAAPGALSVNGGPDRRGMISFQNGSPVTQYPAPGTVYAFQLTPSPTATTVYPAINTATAINVNVATTGLTNEVVDIVSYGINGGAATARASVTHTYATISGKSLSVVFTQPTSFAVNQAELLIEDNTSSPIVDVHLPRPTGGNGIGVINLVPTGAATPVHVRVEFRGFNGEHTTVQDDFN